MFVVSRFASAPTAAAAVAATPNRLGDTTKSTSKTAKKTTKTSRLEVADSAHTFN